MGEKNHRFGKHQSDISKLKNSESNKKTASDPIYRQQNSKRITELHKNPNYHNNYLKKRSENTAWRNKLIERNKTTQIERLIGGFWYGNVSYPDTRNNYCEKFNKEFKMRCRLNDGNKSVLSGKTKSENIVNGHPRELTVHHVYYQKKACCEWDEDVQGYYVMLNIGTKRKKTIIRYDIKGDPNKFVTLTHAENTMANHNKLKWIKIFEDIIESRGGKCYLTKDELNDYIRVHGIEI